MLKEFVKKDGCGLCISHGPVPVFNADIERTAKVSQAIALVAFKYFSAQPYGTQFPGLQLESML
jgi:hypothetical protein